MYVTPEILRAAEAIIGVPRELRMTQEISLADLQMIRASQRHGRAHDVTTYLFADGRRDRVVVIAKHSFPPAIYRVPGGGVAPGESLIDGAVREALEETGLSYHVERYLLRVTVTFACGAEALAWTTHVVTGSAPYSPPLPRDRREIREARWVEPSALTTALAEAMLATGRPLFAYRVALHRAAAEALAADAEGG